MKEEKKLDRSGNHEQRIEDGAGNCHHLGVSGGLRQVDIVE